MSTQGTVDNYAAAVEAWADGRLEAAEALCVAALRDEPHHGAALHMLGTLRFVAGDAAGAVRALQAAAELRLEDAAVHADLGTAHVALGELEVARDAYRRAAVLLTTRGTVVPAAAAVLFNLGAVERRLGHLAGAVAAYGCASQLAPDDASVWANLGVTLRDDGRPEQAVAASERALALEPGLAAAHNNLGAALRELGRDDEAEIAFRAALRCEPALAEAWFNLHGVLFDESDPAAAEAALRQAVKHAPSHGKAWAFLGGLLGLRGDAAGAAEAFANALRDGGEHLVDAWRFVLEHTPGVTLLASPTATLLHALELAQRAGLVIELGVRRGTSIRWLAAHAGQPLHGFDAFEGLPEAWGEQPAGLYSTEGQLPEVPANVTLHPGWFDASLPSFLAKHPGPLRLVNVDCDLYSSARTALDLLAERVVPGTILVFDEYLNNPGWRDEEHRALGECAAAHGWRVRYRAFSPLSRQAVVEIVEV